MSRGTLTALALVLVAAPLAVQAQHDHDQKVEGAGTIAKGWSARADGDEKIDSRFIAAGTGWHVTSGHAAIYYKSDVARGPFTASVTLTQTKAPEHPEAYGIFFAGNNLTKDNESYFYFLVRGDGKFLVNHRASKDEVHKLVPWTDNAAINKADAKGAATNTLTVDNTRADSLRLLVNGKQVQALPKSQVGNVDGAVGIRVNHNLDVRVADLTVKPTK